MIGENFPYVNFHDLNLDWMIKIAKDFLDQYTEIQNIIDTGKTDLNDIIDSGLSQLQDKYENLEGLLDQWYTEHSGDIADQLADALEDLNTWYTLHSGYLDDILETKVASFESQAQQIADNTIETIPSDYTSLSNDVLDLELNDEVLSYANNYLLGGKYHTFKRGYYSTTPSVGSASSEAASANWNTCKIPVSTNDVILINGYGVTGIQRMYAFLDEDGKTVSISSTNLSGPRFVIAPEGSAYLIVNVKITELSSGYFVITGDYLKQTFKLDEIEQGTYGSTDGKENYTLYYSRTQIVPVDDIFEVYIPTNAKYFFYRYDASGNYISRESGSSSVRFTKEALKLSNYVTGSTKYIAISVTINDSETSPATLKASGFGVWVMNKQFLYDELNKIRNSLENYAEKSNVSFITKDFEQGGICSSGEEGTSFIYCRTPYIDINTINYISKPSDQFFIIAEYDSSKTFIARTSVENGSTYTADQEAIQRTYNANGNVKYLRIAVKRMDGETELDSLPADIIASDLVIELIGMSNDEYEQIYTLKRLLNKEATATYPEYYDSYLPGKINTINALEDSVSSKSDNFIFITDYHYTKNAQHSPAIIKDIVSQTGITKLFFGGDAGVSSPYAYMYKSARDNGMIYQKLAEAAPEFYPMIGNHEWNDRQDQTHEAEQQEEVYNRIGVYNYYLRRNAQSVKGMSEEGNYYIDSEREKIRYFVLQVTGQAKLSNETIKWLGDELLNTPDNWYVVVFSHYAYTGGELVTNSMTGRGNLSVIRVSQILGAAKDHTSVTVNKYDNTGSTIGTLTFDFSNKNITPVCIISGHTHYDASLSANDSDYGILTIATTCDAFGYAQNASTHLAEPRQVGTTAEQAFDVVQIDITNRKVYMTRIGGGSNREFSF